MFYSLNIASLRTSAFRLISALQGQPEMIAATTAVVFLLLCEQFSIKAWEALDAAHRMIRDAREADHEGHFSAISLYMQNELEDGNA